MTAMMPKTGFNKEPWKNLLPEVISWLDRVTITKANDWVKDAHHAVVVGAVDDEKDTLEIDAPQLPDAVRAKISASARAIGWRAEGGVRTVIVDGTPVTLVVPSKIKTSARQRARQVGIDLARATKELRIEHLALVRSKDFDLLDVMEGVAAGYYNAVAFKGAKKDSGKAAATKTPASKLPGKITLAFSDHKDDEIARVKHLARCSAFTRALQDAPANWLDPIRFAEIAKDAGTEAGCKVKIHNKEEITSLGMGLFVAVANGSEIEPRLITIEIDGQDNSKTVALIGKGLTFDAGGISLKPSASMEEMKYDMSGGAAVLGSALYLAKVKPPTKVVCIIGATENMPSGSAVKPGDVIVAMNGKTVEIQNTDAEGRLVLADLLHYASTTYNPELMIDIATLTGAVLMALGTAGSALLASDQTSADFVLKSAQTVGEPMWQLPIWPELEKETKGETADLNNIAKPSIKAGTLMGAAFLREFIGDRKWVHLDIAGTGWNTKATGYPAGGGSAWGLKTMVESCMRFGK